MDGLAFAHAVLLRDHPTATDRHRQSGGPSSAHTGAYLGGRALGTRPLAPSISPNKTIEGLAIGFLIGVAAVWLAGLYQDWLSGWHALVLGAAVAAAAPVGDLFESYLKRDAGTKDTGRLFGAHGGALDARRCDVHDRRRSRLARDVVVSPDIYRMSEVSGILAAVGAAAGCS